MVEAYKILYDVDPIGLNDESAEKDENEADGLDEEVVDAEGQVCPNMDSDPMDMDHAY